MSVNSADSDKNVDPTSSFSSLNIHSSIHSDDSPLLSPFSSLNIHSSVHSSNTPSKQSHTKLRYSSTHSTNGTCQLLNPDVSNQKQEKRKANMQLRLAGLTYQLDAYQLALALCKKTRKSEYEGLVPGTKNNVDVIENYHCSLDTPQYQKVFKTLCEENFKNIESPGDYVEEKDHYAPLAAFLNKIIESCQTVLAANGLPSKKSYCKDLRFYVWNSCVDGSQATKHNLKPDLVALRSPCPEGPSDICWKSSPEDQHPEVFVSIEVRKVVGNDANTSADAISQAATYAYCMNDAIPARQYSLALFYNTHNKSLRFLVFHKGGLTLSNPLNVKSDIDDIGRLLLAMLSWERAADAGLPEYPNEQIPAQKADGTIIMGEIRETVRKVIDIHGRCGSVYQIFVPPDFADFDTLPPLPGIDEIASTNSGSARIATPLSTTAGTSTVRQTRSVVKKNAEKARKKHFVMVKFSWAKDDIEARVLKDGNGKFGLPIHFHSSVVEYVPGVPLTNHLFLPKDATYWPVFVGSRISNNYRVYFRHTIAYMGKSVSKAPNLSVLGETVLHAMIGYCNHNRSGYQHRDISDGNVLMLAGRFKQMIPLSDVDPRNISVDAEVLQAILDRIPPNGMTKLKKELVSMIKQLQTENEIEQLLIEPMIKQFLAELPIDQGSIGFLIDGDLAIDLREYFVQSSRNGSKSGTVQFMSQALRQAFVNDSDYLQSPVDDFFSFFFVFQYSAVRLAIQTEMDKKPAIRTEKNRRRHAIQTEKSEKPNRILEKLQAYHKLIVSEDLLQRENALLNNLWRYHRRGAEGETEAVEEYGPVFGRTILLLVKWYECLEQRSESWDIIRNAYINGLEGVLHQNLPPLFLFFTHLCLYDFLILYREAMPWSSNDAVVSNVIA